MWKTKKTKQTCSTEKAQKNNALDPARPLSPGRGYGTSGGSSRLGPWQELLSIAAIGRRTTKNREAVERKLSL